jgi:ABC-2 type transport system ATP-binding protein
VLELDGVTRRFGAVTALDGVGFRVRPGRMTGFVGANGAGKTTAMRIVLGVLAAHGGSVRWHGREVDLQVRRRFGYMPEERGLYPKMRLHDQLTYFGRLHGLTARSASARAGELLARLGLAERSRDRLDELSLGNAQRVQVAAALVHDPELLVLDEPFSGLDPLAVDAMAALLRQRAAAGVPVLFSSHQLELVERLCDDLVILHQGRVVAAGATVDLRAARAGALYRLATDTRPAWLHDVPGVRVVALDGGTALVDLGDVGRDQELLLTALRHGPVREFTRVVPTLAELFREVVR